MESLESIRHRLRDRTLTVVAEAIGVHYNTLYKFSSGQTKDPSYTMIKKLSDYLNKSGELGDDGHY